MVLILSWFKNAYNKTRHGVYSNSSIDEFVAPKEMERRCHYEVLGLDRACSPDAIKSAYRKLALQRHPDKLVHTGVSQSDANAQFQELSHAYEVLSDPKERAWYDSHRSQILFADVTSTSSSNAVVPNLFSFFSSAAFSGYSDTGKGFYKVYSDVFNKIYSAELAFASKLGLGGDAVRDAPAIGNLKSDFAQVTAFYNYWLGFSTVMDFCWADQYDVAAGENRKVRRLMEEDNKKQRRKARREYNETVRGLAEFAKKRDKRVMDMVVKREEERKRKEAEEKERKKKAEMEKLAKAMAYEEPEWTKVEEVEDEIEEEEEERRNELYCALCGKKFKSEKQWKNHEQSKKHKEKVAEFRKSIVDEEEEVEDLGERIKEDLVIESEDEFHDYSDENIEVNNGDEMETLQATAAGHKIREEVSDHDEEEEKERTYELYCALCEKTFKSEELYKNHKQSKKHEDKASEYRESCTARKKHNDKATKYRELFFDEEEEQVDGLGERMKEVLEIESDGKDEFNDFSDEKVVVNDDDGDDDDEEEEGDGELELLKKMATRQKGKENVGEAVDNGESEIEDEADVFETMMAGQKSRKNAASHVEFADPLVSSFLEDNNSDSVESFPMEYENQKPPKRKMRGKKSGGESKRVDINDISNDQSEEACENNNPDMEELVSDCKVENVSTDKQDNLPAKRKKTSKQTVEKKKENVKKEAHGKSKSSSKGTKAKTTSKNSSNACDTCGEEFGSRNQLHKHLGDSGHASLKR